MAFRVTFYFTAPDELEAKRQAEMLIREVAAAAAKLGVQIDDTEVETA